MCIVVALVIGRLGTAAIGKNWSLWGKVETTSTRAKIARLSELSRIWIVKGSDILHAGIRYSGSLWSSISVESIIKFTAPALARSS